MLICSPGIELYSIFGHCAIRIYDPIQNIDKVYNYGTFDFNTNTTLRKDGEERTYSVSVQTNSEKKLEYISGWVLDHSQGTESKHSEVKNIELILEKAD